MNLPSPDVEYKALLTDLSSLCESCPSLFAKPAENDPRRVELYWQMGRRIVDVVQQGKERGAYGQKVLLQLSRDLTEKYGPGFKDRTVRYIRRFAITYSREALRPGLQWSHYRALLAIDDPATRRALEDRVLAENLNKVQLMTLIAQETLHVAFSYTPRASAPGIFKIVINPQSNRPLLDLGFNVTREQAIKGVRDLADGEYLVMTGEKFSRVSCESGARYCYPATVLKVVDGDTVKMRMRLGFGMCIDESMRLRGVDAAEIDTDEGKKAHRAIQKLLKNAAQITVFTWSHDRYGRYIADLIADGVYINKALVESGHARFLKM